MPSASRTVEDRREVVRRWRVLLVALPVVLADGRVEHVPNAVRGALELGVGNRLLDRVVDDELVGERGANVAGVEHVLPRRQGTHAPGAGGSDDGGEGTSGAKQGSTRGRHESDRTGRTTGERLVFAGAGKRWIDPAGR